MENGTVPCVGHGIGPMDHSQVLVRDLEWKHLFGDQVEVVGHDKGYHTVGQLAGSRR